VPYHSDERFCCGGVLSESIGEATETRFWGYALNRDDENSRDIRGYDWNMTDKWGVGKNGDEPSLTNTSYKADTRQKMCVLNSTEGK
jgi:hypothetical protein